jgi:hypothetical protein
MFSREESNQLRQDFWIAFGKSFPHKWTLYDTKIKGLSLKFHFGLKNAMVSMDIGHSDLVRRMELWEKLISLKSILKEEYLPEAIYEDSFLLENQKEISRIYVEKPDVSIHNRGTLQETMVFLESRMLLLETFFVEYRELLNGQHH